MAEDYSGRLVLEDLGQDLIEYALLLTFVAIAVVVGVHALGIGISGRFTAASTAIATAGSADESGGANPNPGNGKPGTGNPGGGNPGAGYPGGNPGGGNPGNGKGQAGNKQ